jgi:chemotaxis methyl-accepting protein methylase
VRAAAARGRGRLRAAQRGPGHGRRAAPLARAVRIDFSLYKTSTVARRVQRRADLLRVDGIAAYAEQLRLDPDELNTLYRIS